MLCATEGYSLCCAGSVNLVLLVRQDSSEKERVMLEILVLPATLPLVTAYVCAVSRLTVSLVQPGSTQKEVPGSPNRPGTERQRGK